MVMRARVAERKAPRRLPPAFGHGPAVAEGLVCLGVVTGARGLKGEVRVKTFTADPADLAAYGRLSDEVGKRSFEASVVARAGEQTIVRLSGIADRTAALALKGTRLCVAREALPPTESGEYYHADLIGMRVELAQGGDLGTVRAVRDYGAGALIEVDVVQPPGARRGTPPSVLIPFTDRAVPVVDTKAGRIVVDPPEGLLPEPRAEGRRRRRPRKAAQEGTQPR